MLHHLTFTHNHVQAHTLSELELMSHPNPTARILYFAIPYAFTLICNLALYARNARVHQNNFIYTLPSNFFSFTFLLISLLGVAAIGVQAVIADTWTLKEWILLAVINIFLGVKILIYCADTKPTLFITTIVVIFVALANQWLFSQLRNMNEITSDQQFWKHMARNIVGFVEGGLVIYSVEYICETMVHMFQVFVKAASFFFWIVAPLAIAGLLMLNIMNFGPFIDSIGCIASSALLFLGAANTTFFHKEEVIPLKR